MTRDARRLRKRSQRPGNLPRYNVAEGQRRTPTRTVNHAINAKPPEIKDAIGDARLPSSVTRIWRFTTHALLSRLHVADVARAENGPRAKVTAGECRAHPRKVSSTAMNRRFEDKTRTREGVQGVSLSG